MNSATKLTRAMIYARVSTDAQRDNYSVPVQIEQAVNYAEERNYVIVGQKFVDPVTGKDLPEGTPGAIAAYVDDHTSMEIRRPGLTQAMAFVAKEKVDVVIVYVLDRFARDSFIRQTLEFEFNKLGARVEYVLGDYDDEYMGETRKDLDDLVAKIENRNRTRRVTEGRLKKAKSGYYVGGHPQYGYKVNKSSSGGLEVIPDRAAVVLRIFNSFVLERESIRTIVASLNQDNIPSPTGKKWGRSTVSRILKYEGYTGVYYYNKRKTKRGLTGRITIPRERNHWIQIEIPPIVSPYLFNLAQKKLAENKEHRRRQTKRGRFYLLQGMIFCARCNKPYVAQTRQAGRGKNVRPSLTYRHRLKEGHCSNKTIAAQMIEIPVWGRVSKLILEPKILIEGYEKSLEQHEQGLGFRRQFLQTLHAEKEKANQKREALLNTYLDPEIRLTKEEYLAAKYQLENAENDLLLRIQELEEELASIPTPADLETFEAFTSEIREFIMGDIEPLPFEKRRLLELMNIKVWIDPEGGKIEITGSFHRPGNDSNVEGGFSNSVLDSCAHRRRQPPWPASHA
ncbi:MAG: recombinase family protein, partial [Anaerolineae bacterium]|nr:recombinase family protein [Anaerolineae bacterium]